MARRRPSSDGMVRKRTDGHWEGRIDKERRVKHLIYKNPTKKVTAPKPNYCPKQILNNKQPDKFGNHSAGRYLAGLLLHG